MFVPQPTTNTPNQLTQPQNAFNATMDPKADLPTESTCTSCQFEDDFSNYWTAVLYFKARNGSYMRVPQLGNNQFEKANGGLTIYYMQDPIYESKQTSKVKAFQPVFPLSLFFPPSLFSPPSSLR